VAEIVLDHVTKRFPDGTVAVDDANLDIDDGEFAILVGPSGSGKSTLLNMIAGLEDITEGEIRIGDRVVNQLSPKDRDIAMVFQDYALYPHMTVLDNIAYPLKVKRVPKAERHRTAAVAGASLQLEATMERRPGQLSGGQQQRVALARAIAYRPQVFLFDEPLSNLDARLRLEARSFLKRLQKELGTTTVYVTHDQSEALALADRMAVMEAGHIRQLGTPVEVFRRPANLFVAGFIGSTPMNLLEATVDDGGLRVGRFRLPLPEAAGRGLAAGDKVVVGVRPEYATLAAEERPGAIAGTVTLLESLGSAFLVSVDSDGVRAQVTVPEGRQPAVGDRTFVVPDPRRLLVYGRDDGELVGAGRPAQDGAAQGLRATPP